MRFLLDWQGVTGRAAAAKESRASQRSSSSSRATRFPRSPGNPKCCLRAWAPTIPAWLDSLCLSGRLLWARLDPPRNAAAGPVRATPIALLRRQNWRAVAWPVTAAARERDAVCQRASDGRLPAGARRVVLR